ncbi:MAG: hydroxyacid dehydrogenase [Spirochaetales bacterium]|nr:hydroxyacid dehydrogenase [Spirochaetales bacterium]
MTTIVTWLTHPAVSCWIFTEKQKRQIEGTIPGVRVIICRDKDAFLSSLSKADIVFVWNFQQSWLKLAPKLRRIITPAAGREFLQLNPPAEISVEYSSFHGKLIAETVLGMILCQSRGILATCKLQTVKQWPREELDKHMKLLRGSLVTILGFGNLGTWIGRLAKPFGVRICGIKRSITPPPDYFDKKDRIVAMDELESVLQDTDHLVLCLPGSTETNNILNRSRLNLLPSHASIYNVGRGNAIDDKALVNALHSGSIGAAYLDVFHEEPLPMDSPLRSCSNCFIMPHASVFAPEFMNCFVEEFLSRHESGYLKFR